MAKAKTQATPAQQAAAYNTIVKPHITEKSTSVSQYNQYVFRVARGANKTEVKNAIECLFNVEVDSVNTMNVKGKTKRFRGRLGQRQDYKKAIVTLKEGQTIDMQTGV
ncbi:MAG: 50S ribosomal protein L23 [Alphaproteobacteria bacterium]|nr:50S ribosomal protein L23 [Alphaproteobacteria bacterium]